MAQSVLEPRRWTRAEYERIVESGALGRAGGYERTRTLRGDDVLAVPEYEVRTSVAELFASAGV